MGTRLQKVDSSEFSAEHLLYARYFATEADRLEAEVKRLQDELAEAVDLLRTIPVMSAVERLCAGGTVESPEPLPPEAVEYDCWCERWSRLCEPEAADAAERSA